MCPSIQILSMNAYLALSGVRPLLQILRFKIRRADKLESFVMKKKLH